MDKKIRYKQTVNIKEHYDIYYTLSDFEYDCRRYKIENLSFDELCDVLNGTKPDFIISVSEGHLDYDGVYVYGPHFVSVLDFFSVVLADDAFDRGYEMRDELEIIDKETTILSD